MRVSPHEDRLLLRLVLQVEELANDQLSHLVRRGAGVKARPTSALHLSGGVTTGIIDHEAIATRPGTHALPLAYRHGSPGRRSACPGTRCGC